MPMSPGTDSSQHAVPQLRRSSATPGPSTLVERLGSYGHWESWEHPANIPLHPPAGEAAYEPVDQQQEQQANQLHLMLGECRQ